MIMIDEGVGEETLTRILHVLENLEDDKYFGQKYYLQNQLPSPWLVPDGIVKACQRREEERYRRS